MSNSKGYPLCLLVKKSQFSEILNQPFCSSVLRHERRGAYAARKAAGATQMCVFEPTFDRVLQVHVVSSAAQPSSKSVIPHVWSSTPWRRMFSQKFAPKRGVGRPRFALYRTFTALQERKQMWNVYSTHEQSTRVVFQVPGLPWVWSFDCGMLNDRNHTP